MNYGFLIDTRSCIGCHACSTACKSENQVPLGVNRTWVKYVETGRYPDVRRSFQVSRCNHCSNPPCVRICPVTAMVQRYDGIVQLDGDSCIGCKACMQACPYDAIYVDPSSGTAAKCHFCAHRVENGLEPACVVVCPTHSIVAGDLDDASSEIARLVASNDVSVRKPEQGTAPKLFYVGGNDVALHPTALPRQPDGMLWAEVLDSHGHHIGAKHDEAKDDEAKDDDAPRYDVHLRLEGDQPLQADGPNRTPATQGVPPTGPIGLAPEAQLAGANQTMAGQMMQVAYNAQHQVPWHWQVPAYLVTKGIGAGVFLLLALGIITGWFQPSASAAASGGLVGLVALVATTVLLVADLERPERFLRIVFRPQSKSWLARGAFILIAFSNLALLWWLTEAATALGWWSALGLGRTVLAWLSLPLAVGTAIYSAFLFGQCEGRDLWQSPLLPWHLLVQAVMMGGAGLALSSFVVVSADVAEAARLAMLVGLGMDLFLILFGEFGVAHASEQAALAAHEITHGKYRRQFWLGSILLGHLLPVALLLASSLPVVAVVAALFSIGGLYAYEHAFVMAPQELPNS